MHAEPPLSREMPCPSCLHGFHHLRCEADLGSGVLCPCRGVLVPGVYPD